MVSRYKWISEEYSSPLKNYNSIFNVEELDTYDLQVGDEGSFFIPSSGSTVKLESFNGFNQTASFSGDNRLGYLVSNTLYTETELDDLIDSMIFLFISETVYNNGDILKTSNFNFNRPNNEEYLYLIWDYRNSASEDDNETPTLALNPDNGEAQVSGASDINVNVISNRSWVVGATGDWFSVINGSDDSGAFFTITSIGDNTEGNDPNGSRGNDPNGSRSFDLNVSTNDPDDNINLTRVFTLTQEGELSKHLIAFNEGSESNACNKTPDTNVWSDSVTFQNSSILYRNETGSLTVLEGFYSDGTYVLECNSSGVVVTNSSDLCPI